MTTTTSQQDSLIHLNAEELITGFKRLDFAPSEVLASHFERIDAVNRPDARGVNALTQEMRESAMRTAQTADRVYLRRDEQPPPLLGVPLVTKEKHAIKGLAVTQGLGADKGITATENQVIIQRIVEAGAVVHARTTTPEFSCSSVTHSGQWGVTRNPWNLEATPGGSSGGSGAALAAGMSVLATASDIGGSTRIPAGFNGLVGYKPPYGRVPGAKPLNADWYRSDGPLGRRVADVALLHSVMAGRHVSDHTSWGPTGYDYLQCMGQNAPDRLRGVRVAYSPTLGGFPVEPGVVENTEALVSELQGAGAQVEVVEPRWSVEQIIDASFSHFGAILSRALLDQVDDVSQLSGYAQSFIERSTSAARAGTLLDSLHQDAAVQEELARTMRGCDVLITPTQGVEMIPAGANFTDGVWVAGQHYESYMAAHMTMPFNTANRCPVMAMPSGLSSVGVPTSVQVVGHPFDEATVFRIAAAIEAISEPMRFPMSST